MDDKPAVEYHPFGTITLNFDDGPVKLRRCRLGDLQFAKDLLEEIRTEKTPIRTSLAAEAVEIRDKHTRPPGSKALTAKQEEALQAVTVRVLEIGRQLEEIRIEIVWHWLAKVATRMGDSPLPPKEEWPLEMLHQDVPGEIIDHWQTRPLASGKTLGNNRTTLEAANSGPPLHIVSSPQEPQPQ